MLPEPVMEGSKLVVVEKYGFESTDVIIDNIFGLKKRAKGSTQELLKKQGYRNIAF